MAMNSFKKLIMMANQRVDNEPSLPKEYVQLEYLEATGTQYILTNVYPNNTYTFDTKLKITTNGNVVPWGVRSVGTYGTANSQCYLNYYNTNIILYSTGTGYPTNYNTGEQAVLGNTYDFRNMWVVDSMIQMTYPVMLFGLNNIGTLNASLGKCIIYRWTAYSKGIAVCDLIPALRIADTKPGMYDLVTGQFFVNQGTGEFVFEMPYIPDTIKPYLCFEAVEDDFQAKYSINPCEYSVDDRKTWNELPADTLTPAISAGSKIYFRGRGVQSTVFPYSRGIFSTTKLFNISGNMLSMVHGSDFLTGTPDRYAYSQMFSNNKNIISVSDDFLNVKNNVRGCYGTFQYSSLTNVNIYDINSGFYTYAFYNSELKNITFTSKDSCNSECFTDALTNTFIEDLDIPYKSIQFAALRNFASSCKYLKKVIIRATSIDYRESNTAYSSYFSSAFSKCPLLNNVTFLVANIPLSKRISNNWLTGVAEEGTIILNKNITWNPEDYRNGNIDNVEGSVTLGETITWGIPVGWEVKYCDPDNIDDIRDYREIDKAWD